MAKAERPERDNVVQLRQRGGNWSETRGKLYQAIMSGTPFKASNMRAEKWFGGLPLHGGGELSQEWRTVFEQDQPDYVVFSYTTPIAWHVPNDADQGNSERWVVPNEKYSRTTTIHQRLVLTALIFNRTEPIETLDQA